MSLQGTGYRALDELLAAQEGTDQYLWVTPDDEIVEATRGLFAGIRVYRRETHWHYVTFGFSDLGEKDSPEPERSGWGFELTCRVPGAEAPEWPCAVLTHLAHYLFSRETFFDVGHHFGLHGSMDGEGPLTAIVFAADPQLLPASTANGKLEFLQIVGLDSEELAALKAWNAVQFLQLMRERDPLLLTDPARPSLLADPDILRRIQEGIERDGSSHTAVMCDRAGWVRGDLGRRVEVTLGAGAMELVREAIPRTVKKGRPFICMGERHLKNSTVVFARAAASAWLIDKDAVVLQLADDFIDTFTAALTTAPAVLAWPQLPNLTLRILPPGA